MIELRNTRYYGKLYLTDSKHLHFVVKLICPPNCRPSQYIGPKCKTSDLLCLDDAILSSISTLSIDWSEVQGVRWS